MNQTLVELFLKVVQDELYESIVMHGGDQHGVFLEINQYALKKAFLKALESVGTV